MKTNAYIPFLKGINLASIALCLYILYFRRHHNQPPPMCQLRYPPAVAQLPPTTSAKLDALPGGVPAVDPEVGAGHEAAGVGEQEDGGAAVVLGPAELAQHVLAGPLRLALGELVE